MYSSIRYRLIVIELYIFFRRVWLWSRVCEFYSCWLQKKVAYKSYFRNLFKLNLSYQFVAIRCRICCTVFFITLITVFVFDSSLLSENGNFKNFPIRKFRARFWAMLHNLCTYQMKMSGLQRHVSMLTCAMWQMCNYRGWQIRCENFNLENCKNFTHKFFACNPFLSYI